MTDVVPGMFGVSIFTGHQPMPKSCVNCPFVMADQGLDYLAPGRLDDIKFCVSLGQTFACHKTAHAKGVVMEEDESGFERPPTWHPGYRQCRGAIDYLLKLAAELGVEPYIHGVEP